MRKITKLDIQEGLKELGGTIVVIAWFCGLSWLSAMADEKFGFFGLMAGVSVMLLTPLWLFIWGLPRQGK